MRRQLDLNIVIGDISLCTDEYPEVALEVGNSLATIHACKNPCHQRACGYRGTASLPPTDPRYLVSLGAGGRDLYLNIIDPDKPLFRAETFVSSLDFMDKHIGKRPVVIHCNKGMSRSVSIATLYFAKRTDLIPRRDRGSFASSLDWFKHKYGAHDVAPGKGILTWLEENWQNLV